MNSMPTMKPEKKVGPIIATLIVVLVVVIAALYFFASRMNQNGSIKAPSAPSQNAAVNNSTANTETDLSSLEAELNSATVDLDNQNF